MKIALGCDHGGLNLKAEIANYLKSQNIEFKDFGTYTEESCDYADIALPVALFNLFIIARPTPFSSNPWHKICWTPKSSHFLNVSKRFFAISFKLFSLPNDITFPLLNLFKFSSVVNIATSLPFSI